MAAAIRWSIQVDLSGGAWYPWIIAGATKPTDGSQNAINQPVENNNDGGPSISSLTPRIAIYAALKSILNAQASGL